MKIKNGIAIACAAATLSGAVCMSGCSLFGSKSMTVDANGFSIELTSAFKKQSIDNDGYNILDSSTILKYESRDILFSVSQIEKEDVLGYHALDLDDFTWLLIESYDETGVDVDDFTTDDGSIDGNCFYMTYSNSYGYRNTQYDFVFAGTEYFYELVFVTVSGDFSKLKTQIEDFVKTSKAEDGLNESKSVQLTTYEIGGMTACLDETFEEYEDEDGVYYYNGVIASYSYYYDDIKYLTLKGLENDYKVQMEDSSTFKTGTTVSGTEYLYAAGTSTATDYIYITALFVDDEGLGYVFEYALPDIDYADYFIDDIFDYINNSYGSVDDYTKPVVVEKTFTGADEATFNYSITLDNTFVDMEWDEVEKCYLLYGPEYGRAIIIEKSEKTDATAAYNAWKNAEPTEYTARGAQHKYNDETILVGYTTKGSNVNKCYKTVFFLERSGSIYVISLVTIVDEPFYLPISITSNGSDKDIALVNAIMEIDFD
ncbi:MAG: hypothetical protein HDP34_04295 [Clostridia bacterium]|nr:hypothetical protein [Clostridia bacterium]